ncbi:hypothetical protein DM860_011577 [Cuscuta australis]|uniref:Uncharacterized protein n=1 Tax=Cuscuta australis TaxID=267555 RepID=A0A328D3U3_9ASTE|nr:hypothetical protein DM860_011577 [Cuscuta australis]
MFSHNNSSTVIVIFVKMVVENARLREQENVETNTAKTAVLMLGFAPIFDQRLIYIRSVVASARKILQIEVGH